MIESFSEGLSRAKDGRINGLVDAAGRMNDREVVRQYCSRHRTRRDRASYRFKLEQMFQPECWRGQHPLCLIDLGERAAVATASIGVSPPAQIVEALAHDRWVEGGGSRET